MASDIDKYRVVYYSVPAIYRPPRTILVLYRGNVKPQNFEAGNDTWMFLDLDSAHYGICGRPLDCIMLMDGITKAEVILAPAWVGILPHLKPDGVVMEAG